MPNLGKIGQRLNGIDRTLFLIFWLHESLRHLHRPPRSKGQVDRRPLRGTLLSSRTSAIISTLIVKIQKFWNLTPKKKFSYIFVKGFLANFEFRSCPIKFLLTKLNFEGWCAKLAKNANFGQNWPTSERAWADVILDILTPWIASASQETPRVKRNLRN